MYIYYTEYLIPIKINSQHQQLLRSGFDLFIIICIYCQIKMSDFYREQRDEEENNIGGNSQYQLDAAVNHNTELIHPPEELNLTLNTEMVSGFIMI